MNNEEDIKDKGHEEDATMSSTTGQDKEADTNSDDGQDKDIISIIVDINSDDILGRDSHIPYHDVLDDNNSAYRDIHTTDSNLDASAMTLPVKNNLEIEAPAPAPAPAMGDVKPATASRFPTSVSAFIQNLNLAASKSCCNGGGDGNVPHVVCGSGSSDSSHGDKSCLLPLNRCKGSQETGPTLFDGLEDDVESKASKVSSYSRVSLSKRASSYRSRNHFTNVEVEIGSVCSSEADDCLYHRHYLHSIWFLYKKRIILGCIMLSIFLLGVLIGACGSGQCGKDKSIESDKDVVTSNGGDVTPTTNNDSDTAVSNNPTHGSGILNPIVNAEPTFLGDKVFVFDPSMSMNQIQSKVDEIFHQQQNNEMGEERYALLFQPGTYGSVTEPLMIQIGYYTEVAGLGKSPEDVKIVGKVEVYNRVSTGKCSLETKDPSSFYLIQRSCPIPSC